MTSRHFISAAVGTSPAIMLRARRALQAQSLMRTEPSLPAREIALRNGFSSSSSMKRALLAAVDEGPSRIM
ncbi:helix-turn-helix domain-containing protein [Pseudoclavibacter helvolus]|uniref:helix-turn-helix domain-containing protein n=1 Tax=Pseudoclavibacter helvolus TaxID=255205 RepID=UPI0012E8814C